MSYRPNLPVAFATTMQAGVIKADGSTITVGPDATASVVGTAVTALTDISSGTLGGPASSDIDTLNRGGTDYKTTLSARAAFFRKTPAGSRTITLASGATIATLTAMDNDKQVVVSGVSGSLSVDGTITDGFRCLVVNKTAGALAYSGISGLGGLTALSSGTAAQVYMAASATEASQGGNSYMLPPATTAALGGVKPDGASLSVAADGTLSVLTTTTHALPAGPVVNTADEIATFSIASSSDVKYTVGQLSTYTQTNIQSWPLSARPAPAQGQYVLGFNSTAGRFEFWNGSAWTQHVRVNDLAATSSQLLGGSGTNGVAVAVAIGSGLQLTNSVLSTSAAAVPVSTVVTSGSSQALAFASSGSRAYDVTLTANCTFSVSGGVAGELQTVTVIIRGGNGGFSVTLPSNVKWKGGTAPTVDTSAGSINVIRLQTSDGGTTYAGNF